MASTSLYIACLIGALGVYSILRPGARLIAGAGAVAALGAFAWLLVEVAVPRGAAGPGVLFWAFAVIAVVSAVRLISHARPVYSALYFVLVVLSSAGLFLLLDAEFMAFALVIVYAGAILITYMFVLMLAQQAPDPQHPEARAAYDAVAREPAAAATVGFIMIALFTHMIVDGGRELRGPDENARVITAARELDLMPRQLEQAVTEARGDARAPDGGFRAEAVDGAIQVAILDAEGRPDVVTLPESAMPPNIQRVGVSLVADFPASLELAGVILLLAMFGAVVLARRQIELSEDETREAAGLRRFDFTRDDRDDAPAGGEGEGTAS